MWSKGIVDWIEGDTAYVSVPFTWNLPQAFPRCAFLKAQGYTVRAGGPAVDLMPSYLSPIAEIGSPPVNALPRHNPNATFTSRGCPRKCKFCAVPIIEGSLVELKAWNPKPIICDNNLLACSKTHFDKVVDSLKGVQKVDFNQGLDARLLTPYQADRLAELDCKARLAWDHVGLESQVMNAISMLRKAGFPKSKIQTYVLIGFQDTPEDALYRLQTLKSIGILPNPQRFNPLNTLKRDSYVSPNWTNHELKRFMRYWARQAYLSNIPFHNFSH